MYIYPELLVKYNIMRGVIEDEVIKDPTVKDHLNSNVKKPKVRLKHRSKEEIQSLIPDHFLKYMKKH